MKRFHWQIMLGVSLVILIIHRLLGEREKRTRLEKLNIVIGVFFSEVGKKLLTYFSDFDPKLDSIRQELIVTEDWSDQEFLTVSRRLNNYGYDLHLHKVNLDHLHGLLVEKRDFLVRFARESRPVGARVLYGPSSGRFSHDRRTCRQRRHEAAAGSRL